ncbi:hypothetical protein TWF225_010170 [Orbilia oligospora]|uniref:Uncharacterized protein n=1 Tax=Orbilia oligospora TaxID=2813651 RepID=A0A7C8TRX8_ORBOL|nr:hypothetical protein TWF751_001435 [Orbilia oligospora]KAF3193416.1 hypothetical protein TWF225_010170 [Orbilia oligospora]KAF3240133.1 hypothetical protein TWF128_011392 [Orbilia oligospora]KAF3243366.1 hypothetical protein TWF217_011286 [Orbilia oligospora]KAF3296276.1 hypothetical protein TWF132_010879 [Orbilia oligospora]
MQKYKTRQIKLPRVESRRDYEEFKSSAGKGGFFKAFFNRPMLPSTIVYYNIYDDFSVKEVARQLSVLPVAGCNYREVQAPLTAYRNSLINGTPTIFYAVYSRDPEKIKKWLKEGADPNSVADLGDLFDSKEDGYKPVPVKMPLLAFAILLEEPEIVRLLLTFGANPLVIPGILRLPVIKPAIYRLSKSPEGITKEFVENTSRDEATKWCTDAVVFNRLKLATNLSIRYDLQKADTFKITARQRQLAQDPQSKIDYTPLFKLHFDIIGQDLAVKKIIQELLRRKVRKISSWPCESTRDRPTVFIFAGPKDHGQSKMITQIVHNLGIPFFSFIESDHTLYSDPDGKNQMLEPLLDEQAGSKSKPDEVSEFCIFVLENVEEMSSGALNSLFTGPIKANKDGSTSRDLSKTIWVVTTNILNPMITAFYEEHRPLTPEKMMGKEGQALMSAMKKFVRSGTTNLSVFADYVDSIIPFFPFDENGQLALAHRGLWKLRSQLLRPIRLANDYRRNLLGNIKLVTEKDYQHCRMIAKSYNPNEGAGSMKQAVADIEREIFYHFLESSEDAISEKDEKEVTEYILKVEKENDAILVQTGNVMPKEDF